VEATTAAVLVPTFGGKVAGVCDSPCEAPLGRGGATVLHGGYELGSGLGFGIAAGYLSAEQHVSKRSAKVQTTPMAQVSGTVDDQLALRGGLAGAWVGYTLGERLPLHLRLGAGVLAGDFLDERSSGAFAGTLKPSDMPLSFSTPHLASRYTAVFLYATPEARVGWPIGRHVVLQAAVAVPVLIGLVVPTWDVTQSFRTRSVVSGQFLGEALIGRVVVAIAPGLGARYDF
jgi:hypothetical protein